MLKIKNLSFSYQNQFVIDNLSLELKMGDYCAILGPNGAGKSTLFNLIAGLLKPSFGDILIDNQLITRFSIQELAQKLAVVPQYEEVVYDFSVFDMVMMGRMPYQGRWSLASQEDKQLVEEILEQTDLAHLRNRMTRELSGGERQRTLVARAMAQQTPLILFDEPLSNLDIAHKYELLELIETLHNTGRTILVIMHELSLVKEFIPKTLFLKQGKIDSFGATTEVMTIENIRRIFNLSERYTPFF